MALSCATLALALYLPVLFTSRKSVINHATPSYENLALLNIYERFDLPSDFETASTKRLSPVRSCRAPQPGCGSLRVFTMAVSHFHEPRM